METESHRCASSHRFATSEANPILSGRNRSERGHANLWSVQVRGRALALCFWEGRQSASFLCLHTSGVCLVIAIDIHR